MCFKVVKLQKIKNIEVKNTPSIYDFKIKTLDGTTIDFADFKGRKMLLVNTASKCGFTPQYAELETVYNQYDVQIIGFPTADFGNQEYSQNTEIADFCERNFGVSFPITEKISVSGNEKHPLFEFLTRRSQNKVKSSVVVWNFQKYLIDEQGKLIDWFLPFTPPTSRKITKHLKKRVK